MCAFILSKDMRTQSPAFILMMSKLQQHLRTVRLNSGVLLRNQKKETQVAIQKALLQVVRNLEMLFVGRLRHTFSTRHNLNYHCLITKSQNPPDRVNIRAYVEYFFARDSLFSKVQQMVQIQQKKIG